MISRMQNWFGNGWIGIVELLITALCVFLSLSVHEFAHGYAAYKMGDNTAKNMGRLNLSPMSHLDPIGALCLFLFGFGWARPVPVNPRNFKSGKFKSGMVWTSIAGPLSNIILAFFAMLFLSVIAKFYVGENQLWNKVLSLLVVLLSTLVYLNINLAVFNLIPVPPLDGSKVLNAILPARIYFKIMQYEQYGFILLIILINTPLFSRLLNSLSNIILNGIQLIIGFLPFL